MERIKAVEEWDEGVDYEECVEEDVDPKEPREEWGAVTGRAFVRGGDYGAADGEFQGL